MKFVSIITVNFNQPAVTEQLFASLPPAENYEMIVVDNGSTENCIPRWEKEFPHFIFIRSEENLGFAGGNNLGLRRARGDYFFLVNNDTEFTPGLLQQLISTLEANESVGMVSPKIRYFDQPGLLQYVGYTAMNYFTGRNKCVGQFEVDKGQYDDRTGKTAYAHGAAMMVKKVATDKAGMMAENFFLYYEELDWCERIRKAGFEIWVDTKAVIYHKESVSVGKQSALKEYYMNRNRILFERKHAGTFVYPAFMLFFLLVVVPRNILNYILHKQFSFIPLLMKAIGWNFSHSVSSDERYFPGKI